MAKKSKLKRSVSESGRNRPGEFCDECHRRKDTKKVGDIFLCASCLKTERSFSENHFGRTNIVDFGACDSSDLYAG